MNQPSPRSGRLTTLLVLLLHFLVVAAAPVVDGGARLPADAGAHIEAPSDAPCYPVHDDLHCQICHALGHNLLSAPRVLPAFASLSAVALAAPVMALGHPRVPIGPSLGPRAPPYA